MSGVIKFGTDGWRAIIAEDFTFENVRICAQAVAEYLKETNDTQRGLIVGYDTRFLSENFGAAVAEVMAGNGTVAYLCDRPAPTPAISWAILDRKAAGAVIITASHNPGIWNGFKYKPDYAGSASPQVVAALEKHISATQAGKIQVRYIDLERAREKGLVRDLDPRPAYLEQVKRLVNVEAIKKAGLTVVVDAMFGAGMGYFPTLLDDGTTKVIEIHNVRNPLFPGLDHPEPIDHNLKALAQAIAEHKANAGLATDGDADRIGLMDEQGNFINQLQVYGLLLLYLLEVRGMRGPIIKTVTTTAMANKLAKLYDLPVYETPVGFKYVGPMMMEKDAIFGGEESGGFGFKGHIPERDGIVAGLFLLDLMIRKDMSPSRLVEYLYSLVGPHYYDRIDVHFPPEDRGEVTSRVQSCRCDQIAGLKVLHIDSKDGFKFNLEDGSWLLIRFSGTEPLIRIYTETTRQDLVQPILEAGLEIAGLEQDS